MLKSLAAAVVLMLATPAAAEVVERGPDHFVLRYEADLRTSREGVQTAIGEIGRWWDGSHTYSGDAGNLSLQFEPGGCLCEAMPDGTRFEHGRLVEIAETGVVLDAPLGPLKGRATVAQLGFGWVGTDREWSLIMTYVVRGPGVGAWADGVDSVMGGQFNRLTRYIEAGETPAPADASS
ncbi:MAG: hypothetical protein REJ23_06370 [Brevundimonas sp.]|nr:hypothetical protein [Brevundimonas sp.]